MSEPNQTPPEDKKPESEPDQDPAPNDGLVPKEVHDKTIKSKQHWAEKAKALELELAEIKTKQLKEKEDYKSLYEAADKKVKEYDTLIQEQKIKEVQSYKLSSLKKELEKMGANKDSMEALLRLADLGTVKFDEENKVAYGTEEEAKRIKAMLPPAFGVSQSGASHAAPNAMPADITVEGYQKLFATGQWAKMSKEDRKAYEAKLYESRGVSVKK